MSATRFPGEPAVHLPLLLAALLAIVAANAVPAAATVPRVVLLDKFGYAS